MLAIRNLLKVNHQILKSVSQQRSMSVVATPARNKVSKGTNDQKAGAYLGQRISIALQRGNAASLLGTLPAEQVVLATLMVIGWSAIPAWVLVNIKNYRHDE